MTLADFTNASEGVYQIALYNDGEINPICYTRSDWKGVEPYMGRKIARFNQKIDEMTNKYQVDIFLEKGD